MTPADATELERLVKAAQAGDHEAFVALIERLRPRLWARAFARTADRIAAEDLIQDAALQAFQKIETLHEPRAVGAWMIQILDRLALQSDKRSASDERRAEIHDELQPANEDAGVLFDAGEWDETVDDLRAALQNLSPDDRELLALRFDANLSAPEIAREIGSTTGAVRTRLCRTLGKLRTMLGALL